MSLSKMIEEMSYISDLLSELDEHDIAWFGDDKHNAALRVSDAMYSIRFCRTLECANKKLEEGGFTNVLTVYNDFE